MVTDSWLARKLLLGCGDKDKSVILLYLAQELLCGDAVRSKWAASLLRTVNVDRVVVSPEYWEVADRDLTADSMEGKLYRRARDGKILEFVWKCKQLREEYSLRVVLSSTIVAILCIVGMACFSLRIAGLLLFVMLLYLVIVFCCLPEYRGNVFLFDETSWGEGEASGRYVLKVGKYVYEFCPDILEDTDVWGDAFNIVGYANVAVTICTVCGVLAFLRDDWLQWRITGKSLVKNIDFLLGVSFD